MPVLAAMAAARRADQRAAQARPGAGRRAARSLHRRSHGGAARRAGPRRPGSRWSGRSTSPRTAPTSEMAAHRAAMEDQFLEAAARRRLRRHAGLQLRADRPGRARRARRGDLRTLAHDGVPAAGARRRRAPGVARCCPACRCWSPRTASPPRDDERPDRASPATRCAAWRRRSPTASTCAATCTGACWTTSSGSPATSRPSVWSSVDRETFVRTPKPSLAWLGGVARSNGL